MRFNGEWLQCDDGIVRPVLRAEIETNSGSWRALELLVDMGNEPQADEAPRRVTTCRRAIRWEGPTSKRY